MHQSSPTELFLPQSFPFPIKIVSLDAGPDDDIQRGVRLLTYSFVYISRTPGVQPETRFGTWDAAVEGRLESWKLKVGDVVSQKKAKDRPALIVVEPCKHGMQHGGLCVLCGKDMTNVDYTGFSDASRASIQMTHSAFGPTVSLEEAQRIERETAEHLLKSRKLSLIVDLDQTIVHATVDPTVGEWIAEGEAWEAKQAQKAPATVNDSDDSNDSSSSDSEVECNPNWEALKDVKKFRLGPESFSTPSMRTLSRPKGKQKMVENEGCMYYIKPRPGWKKFLRDMAAKYDMHVYTMGTRAYAEEVCAAIDPDGNIFKGRILSRDESGSLTQKSLQRLFPCDTSMVVIIDDRADVWEWSPNLIKVIPYDFFIGIGDINSSFLAKLTSVTPSLTPTVPNKTDPPPDSGAPDALKPSTIDETEKAEMEEKLLLTTNNAALDEQFKQRPLAKKQEELEEEEERNSRSQTPNLENKPPDGDGEKPIQEQPIKDPGVEKHRHALLKNDDAELDRVTKLLDEVHKRFFEAYDSHPPDNSRRKATKVNKPCDVTYIIPRIRSEVLSGVHMVFSGVIPLDTPQETTDYWRLAHMFGAKCYADLTSEVTHVVTAKLGTRKVEVARKRGTIKIVRPEWFNDSIAFWNRQDETPYLLYDPTVITAPSSSPLISDHQISSDPEPDADDWDIDPTELKARAAAESGERGSGPVGALQLGEIDWNDINDEVEAAMMESDDEESLGGRSERNTGVTSEDEWTDEGNVSANNTPRMKRKRLRSLTPSDVHKLQDDDGLRSPLAKRKKLAADRMAQSRLKQAITADELASVGKEQVVSDNFKSSTLFGGIPNGGEHDEVEDDDDDEEEEVVDEEDDFLARDLQEE